MIDCCIDCPNRVVGCHGSCEEYKKQKEEHFAKASKIYKKRKEYRSVRGVEIATVERMKTHHKSKKRR